MEYKQSQISDIKVLDESQGIVEAYTNSMGIIDSDGDVIEASAFNNSIQNNLPIPALVGHNPSAVVGKVVDAQAIQQPDGSAKLYNKIQFNMDTQAGKDAYSNVAGGYVREWSVGFNIPENGVELDREENKLVRRIKDLDWVEVSSVLRGASPNTGTLSAKSEEEIEMTEEEQAYFENFNVIVEPDESLMVISEDARRALLERLGKKDTKSEQSQQTDLEPPEVKSTEPEHSHSADKDQVAELENDDRDTIAERLIASRLRRSKRQIAKGLN